MADGHSDVRTNRDRAAAVVEVIDRASRDGRFRAELRHDPLRTAAACGLELSAADWAGLRDVLSG